MSHRGFHRHALLFPRQRAPVTCHWLHLLIGPPTCRSQVSKLCFCFDSRSFTGRLTPQHDWWIAHGRVRTLALSVHARHRIEPRTATFKMQGRVVSFHILTHANRDLVGLFLLDFFFFLDRPDNTCQILGLWFFFFFLL